MYVNEKLFNFFVFCLGFLIPFKMMGMSYERFSNGYSIHVLTVNPKEHFISPIRATGDNIQRETVLTLAKKNKAQAAINGGFWKPNGQPSGILKIANRWYGTPSKPRGAIGWSARNHRVLIDRILTNYSLADCPIEDSIQVIPVSNPPYTTPEAWSLLENIVGGAPVLVQNGTVVEDFSPEQTLNSFLTRKHPRTAVGIKPNGEWVFVVVDGGWLPFFGGMTIKDLAQLMFDLGCMEALNLDGGGSSTMVMDGKVINEPSGKIEEEGKYVEAVSDAILIFDNP